jgi:chemosensory pili system protein ChpA (sensor histidine kinase/response regulator)
MTDNKLVVADELEDIAMLLAGQGQLADDIDLETSQAFASGVQEEFQRLELASEMLDYEALNPILSWVMQNIEQVKNNPASLVLLQNDGHFFQWVELLAASLRQKDTLLLPELKSCLTHPDWPVELSEKTLQTFLLTLATPEVQPDVSKADHSLNITETVAEVTPTDSSIETQLAEPLPLSKDGFSIEWDKDVHPEILEAFLADTPDQIVESTALIHKIANGNASTEEHQLAARLTHTIKGASGVVGVTSLIAFTHELEEILEYSVENKLASETKELLLESADCLDGMGEAMMGQKPLPEQFDPLLTQLKSTAKRLNHASLQGEQASEKLDDHTIDGEDEDNSVFEFTTPQTANPQQLADKAGTEKLGIATELLASQLLLSTPVERQARTRNIVPNESTMRVPISLIDDLLNLAEELVTSTSQVNDQIKFVLQQCQQLRHQDDRLATNMDELEQSIDTQFRQVRQQNTQNAEFDQLELEVYNELHSVHGLLNETIADNREIERSIQENLRDLSNQLHSQQRINRELNATILNTRMESLDVLTPRLERIVRETCRSTGKKADFTITGNNLAVDTDILKGITDPLLHLLRNSVDHGIEDKEQRLAKGKPESGLVELSFKQEGRYVLMTLRDDGSGIDTEAVYQRALSRGIITSDQTLTETDKLQLILLPGLTTRDAVSNISGRGVGMDVVNDAVSKLRGTLEINSTSDQGTEILVRLPLTLVAANTLMVEVSGRTVAVPVDSIDRLHTLSANTLDTDSDTLTIVIADKTYQVRRLSQLLNWGNSPVDASQTYNVILIDHKQIPYALIIDSVLQPREVVVKSLAPWLSNIPGVNGACLLSDGAVAAVLDIPRLLQFDNPLKSSEISESSNHLNEQPQLVLVVDDSLSNRKALSITAEQLGYRTVMASDGEEALRLVAEEMPDVILSDLEMPRMNGLELSQAIRSWTEAKHIPIVMITSRATTKHRKQAQLAGVNSYIVKPVDRDTLQNQLKKWLN